MGDYQHYVRVIDGVIVYGFSDAFETPRPDDICIDDDAPRHFSVRLINDAGQHLYRWSDGVVLRSETELEEELATLPPTPPTPEQRVEQLEQEKTQLEQRVLAVESAMLALMDMS